MTSGLALSIIRVRITRVAKDKNFLAKILPENFFVNIYYSLDN